MKGYSLDQAMSKGKSNNLNLLRFIAALAVIFSHSYPLSLGAANNDFMTAFSNGKLGIGGIAVGVFFLSSGLLVSKSIERKHDTKKYFKARCLRIFPPLIAVVLISVFIIGPIFTELSLFDYLFNPKTYLYLLNALLIPIHSLPGVFTNNIYGAVVNGALWTLPLEFICYIALFFCFQLKILNKKSMKYTLPLCVIGFILCFYTTIPVFTMMKQYLQPVFIFYIGMVAYVYRDKIILNGKLAGLLSLVWLALIYTGSAEIAMVFIFPYIILTIVYSVNQCSGKVSSLGNYSYGIYLCGFPIQQMIVYLFSGEMEAIINFVIAAPIAFLIGIIIYQLIEKPILHKPS